MYISKTNIEKYLLISIDVTGEPFVESVIQACQTYIENLCGDEAFGKRVFEAPASDVDVTKYFNGNGSKRINIGDLREVTSVTVDGVALVQNTDYYLYPLNAGSEGRPYTAIELVQPETNYANANPRSGGVPYIFEELQRNVVVVGKWGYSEEAPADIQLALTKLASGVIRENLTDPSTKTISSETLGEYSVTYSKMSEILNQVGALEMIESYKRSNAKSGRKVLSGTIQAS